MPERTKKNTRSNAKNATGALRPVASSLSKGLFVASVFGQRVIAVDEHALLDAALLNDLARAGSRRRGSRRDGIVAPSLDRRVAHRTAVDVDDAILEGDCREGVERMAIGAHFIMEVRRGRPSRRSDLSYDLARVDGLADRDGYGRA